MPIRLSDIPDTAEAKPVFRLSDIPDTPQVMRLADVPDKPATPAPARQTRGVTGAWNGPTPALLSGGFSPYAAGIKETIAQAKTLPQRIKDIPLRYKMPFSPAPVFETLKTVAPLVLKPWERMKQTAAAGVVAAQEGKRLLPATEMMKQAYTGKQVFTGKQIVKNMGLDTEDPKMSDTMRFIFSHLEAWYDTFGTDPIYLSSTAAAIPYARKANLVNQIFKEASKKANIVIAGETGMKTVPKTTAKLTKMGAKGYFGRQIEIAGGLKKIPEAKLKKALKIIRDAKYVPRPKLTTPTQPPPPGAVTIARPAPTIKPIIKPVVPLAKPPAGVVKLEVGRELAKQDFQNMVIAGQKLVKEIKEAGLKKSINLDGTISIFHASSPENIQKIKKEGRFKEEAFFSPLKGKSAFGSEGATDFAKRIKGEVIEIKADARSISFNQGSGEIEAAKELVRGKDGIWRTAEVAKPIPTPAPLAKPPAGVVGVEPTDLIHSKGASWSLLSGNKTFSGGLFTNEPKTFQNLWWAISPTGEKITMLEALGREKIKLDDLFGIHENHVTVINEAIDTLESEGYRVKEQSPSKKIVYSTKYKSAEEKALQDNILAKDKIRVKPTPTPTPAIPEEVEGLAYRGKNYRRVGERTIDGKIEKGAGIKKTVSVFEPQPLKPSEVKKQVREVSGQIKPSKPVAERVALKAAFQKAAQAARQAYRVGKYEEARKYKEYQKVLGYAMAKRIGLSIRQVDALKKIYIQEKDIRTAEEILTAPEAETLKEMISKVGIKVGLGRPVIPKTKRVVIKGFFPGMQFNKPGLAVAVTDQMYYAQLLGVKPLVEKLEVGKQEFDLTYRKLTNEVYKQGKIIEKLGKTTTGERMQAKVKNIPTKAIARMRDALDQHEEAPAFLSPQEKEIFNWFRELNRDILKKQNAVRVQLDLEPIKYRKAYVRHTAEAMAREMLEGKYPFPQELSYWSKKVVGKKIYNPMEFHRELADDLGKLWTRDLVHATQSMLWTGLKEIYLSQPLKFFNETLGAVSKDPTIYEHLSPEEKAIYNQTHTMPASTKKWVIDYVNGAIKGQQTGFDEMVNGWVTEGGLKKLFDKTLAPFGRVISRKPVTNLFQTMGRMTIHGVMGPLRPKQLIRNKFQRVQDLAFRSVKAILKSFLPATKGQRELMDKSLFLKGYTGFEELPVNIQGRLEQINLGAFQWSAVSNATQSMKAGYWHTVDKYIAKSSKKKYGWADPQRTYKEPKEFLYASEKEKVLKEMEFGASAAQYGYIPLHMPGMFRHKGLIPLTRLQSWWMNHFFKFNREAITRAFKGQPGWSDGSVKLDWADRLGYLKYLILGGLILNSLGYYRSFLFGAAPSGLPPAGQLMLGMYKYAINTPADTKWKKWKKAQAERQMFYAIKTFIPSYLAFKDFNALMSGDKPLEEYFFYKKTKKQPIQGVGSRAAQRYGRSRR